MPFSNAHGAGFENKLADMLAGNLHETVRYTWIAEHEDFVKKTLDKGKCDAVMGVPAGFDEAETTQPYYASGYVFVSRTDRNLNLSSMRDPRLKRLAIGLHVLGDDNTPPQEALSRQGILGNVHGFMIYRDSSYGKAHSHLIDAVADGKLDVAAVWGPLGGYYAKHSAVPLTVAPITDTAGFGPVVFRYAISVGVRKGDDALRAKLDAALVRHKADIRNLLIRYGIPLAKTQPSGSLTTGG
jgi:quinoprotein dehydrogenase-associated probable ABC transporter substrate-binding protein